MGPASESELEAKRRNAAGLRADWRRAHRRGNDGDGHAATRAAPPLAPGSARRHVTLEDAIITGAARRAAAVAIA